MPREGEDQESNLELIVPLCSQQVGHPESACQSLAPATKINAENLTLEGKLKELRLFCLKKERTIRQQVKYISKCKVFMQG